MRRLARIGGALLLIALVIGVIAGLWLLLAPKPPPPPDRGGLASDMTLDDFKIGIGCVESKGDYDALNAGTQAHGRYQILPVNWKAWAGRFLDDPNAPQTPANQEQVATKRFNEIRRAVDGDFARVAYWWLTGGEDPDRSTWSAFATSYVDRTMAYAVAAQTVEGRETIPVSCFSTPDELSPAVRPSWPPAPEPTEPSTSPDLSASPSPSGP